MTTFEGKLVASDADKFCIILARFNDFIGAKLLSGAIDELKSIDVEKIDYVIIHELSHIKHFDHSKAFWNLVSKYCKNYKQIRKEMKD